MADGSPSLAPQWLKSANSLSLRPGSHSAAASDETKSWRESGAMPSRLGLGAGADREAAGEGRPHSLGSRREWGTFSERGSGRGGQAGIDRRNSFPRTPTRPLSDRDILEQSPSLSAPPQVQPRGASREGEQAGVGFPADPFKPVPGNKLERRLSGGRAGASQKPAGSRRHGGSSPQQGEGLQVERDFAPLGRQVSLSPRVPSPRGFSAEQPWPARAPELAPTATLSDAAAAAEAAGKASPTPRMADAILQAQTIASQEAEARQREAARKEQLALRQSKQLVPVVANPKSKHTASLPTASLLTSLKKPSGLEALGRGSLPTLIPAARKDEDVAGHKSVAPAPVRPHPTPAGGRSPPRAAVPPAKPARERDRLNFFSSLKRKTSLGGQENGNLGRQGSNVSEAASLGHSPKANGEATGVAQGVSPQQGEESSSMPEMTPEEIAFMRSLGWEDDEDDVEGGLTEEEVAAFKAQQARKPPCSQQKQGSHPRHIPIHTNGKGAVSAAKSAKGAEPRSFHSELEFSDSDSGL